MPPHEFAASLAKSHVAADLPLWREVYEKAFPTMIAMHNHREDGPYQRAGVDRSIVLASSKQILVDEKVRWRNEKTGRVYEDIALEYVSNDRANTPGWVCKTLLADYVAYAIAPIGVCYLLPVLQLQHAWAAHGERWLAEMRAGKRKQIVAENRGYRTLNVSVWPKELFPLLGECLRPTFTPLDSPEDAVPF